MGAWATLSLDDATLKGMAPTDLSDPDFGEHDTDRATTDMVQGAKEYIEVRLMAAIPRLVVKAPGPEAFMDAAVAITNVANPIQQMLGRAFLFLYYGDAQFSNLDVYEFRKQEQKALFEEVFNGFTLYIQSDVDFLEQLEITSDTGLDKYSVPVFVG